MPKLTPHPQDMLDACEALDGHIALVASVIGQMEFANDELDAIATRFPTLFSERRGPYSDALHQVKVSTSTTVWRMQSAYLKMLVRRLREEEACLSSSSSSQLLSQSETQPTSTEDTPS